jgi:hypothetical protein
VQNRGEKHPSFDGPAGGIMFSVPILYFFPHPPSGVLKGVVEATGKGCKAGETGAGIFGRPPNKWVDFFVNTSCAHPPTGWVKRMNFVDRN